MGKRFGIHAGSLDNLSQMASVGCDEAGLVKTYEETYGAGNTFGSTAAAIHAAGIKVATLNLFNDGNQPWTQPDSSGAEFQGYFQAVYAAGWNVIAGESIFQSVGQAVQNCGCYENYAGCCDAGGGQVDVYATRGIPQKNHWDIIETYGNSGDITPNAPAIAAKCHSYPGGGHFGLLIGFWMLGVSASQYASMLNSCGGDSIIYWGGYDTSSSTPMGHLQQMVSIFGAAKTSGSATTVGSGTTATAAAVSCPCRHITIAFAGASGASEDQHIEFKVKITGTAGWVDDNEKWIPNRPFTGKLSLWTRNSTKSWKLMDFYPDSKGAFAFYVGSDTPENRVYSVCFAD
jgi:hypothetical protein